MRAEPPWRNPSNKTAMVAVARAYLDAFDAVKEITA
jgi:hypothetical protein